MTERSRSASPDDGATDEFGPYVVHELLGQGGMAMVHRAEKRGVGIRRQVALKRLLPHVAEDPELVQLFVDEARLASHLHHANVAQTYDLGKVDDTFFIAMEYAPGPTLTQIVRQCQRAACEIPLPVAVNLLGQVCDALDYAHNLCDETGQPLRIIHRDVSPGNIVVTNSGVVKLIDFGIAKATISSVKTQAGFIKGKFGYIAPEYITGSIDSRVDLFAIGVVAHEMLAGRRLFEGKDDFETLDNLRHLVVQPPSKWSPKIPADLDDVVMKALARDPDNRWQTAGSMRIALAGVARSLGAVVGSPQVVEWVQWAFSQLPREPEPVRKPMMVDVVRPNDTDEVAHLTGGVHGDSSVLIQFSEPSADPPRRDLPLRAPADASDVAPLDQLLVSFTETPPPELLPRPARPDARPRAQTIRPDDPLGVLPGAQAAWRDDPAATQLAATAWHDDPVPASPPAAAWHDDPVPSRTRPPSWQEETIAAPLTAREWHAPAPVKLPLPSPAEPEWGDEPATGRRPAHPSSQPFATVTPRPFDAVAPGSPPRSATPRPFDAVPPGSQPRAAVPQRPPSRPLDAVAPPPPWSDTSQSFTTVAPPPTPPPAPARDRSNPFTPSPPPGGSPRDRSQPFSPTTLPGAPPPAPARDRSQPFIPSTLAGAPPPQPPRDRMNPFTPPATGARDRSHPFTPPQPTGSTPPDAAQPFGLTGPSPARDASQPFGSILPPGTRVGPSSQPFSTVTPLPARDASQPFGSIAATPPAGPSQPFGAIAPPPAATTAQPPATAAKLPPAPTGRAAKARPRSESQRRRTVMWLVLLIVALGIASMAIAYYWPSSL